MQNNRIKTETGGEISLCDYHTQQLTVPWKYNGVSADPCCLCVASLQAVKFHGELTSDQIGRSPTLWDTDGGTQPILGSSLQMKKEIRFLWIVTYKVLDKSSPDCKVICSACIDGFLQGNSAEVVDKRDAPKEYSCNLCKCVATGF